MAHSTYPWFSFRILKELHVCNLTNYIRHTKGRYQETIHLNTSILLYCTPVHNSTEKHLLFTSNQDQINVPPINSYRNLTNFQKLHHPHSLKKLTTILTQFIQQIIFGQYDVVGEQMHIYIQMTPQPVILTTLALFK